MYSLSIIAIELILQILIMYYIIYIKKESIENVLIVYVAMKIITSLLLPRVFGYNFNTLKNELTVLLNKNNKYLGLSLLLLFIFMIISISIPFMIVDNYGLIAILAKMGIDSLTRPLFFI